ncbi:methyltetrahydrofolate cobalamin methyltransferase [Sporomusa acidovorans]|uniref:5-methyltetrahydrofolate:corrinoid/iron-sulfur protein co-methyltransferase n=1 Tax=Sporomusa acidovorans (strain ATCC 49682 / DSM 3132 / Mol) TaxID=1123286 RepID=A0ABZ3J833_SPOA4|nr:methyltetrahydrofolate cobalamin methyltransferase [Sporomusa acidovorans]OZC21218.1 5-methyltetrahydrofolate:corrinoid/iron-sulfur protein co-methyltransferase [Sporomusa acidovorans DSM 3132]SDE65116.1 5-methyltetrahydrofolate--homocysteine methyltransferase [Sporomusa acidovorans]
MLVVGELINASRKAIKAAIEAQDAGYIQKIAKDEVEAGSHYIDVNAGIFVGKEAEYLQWLVKIVQEVVDAPCCIDSPDPKCIEQALKIHEGTAMVNSISLEQERYNAMLPLIAGTDLKVVALCMSDEGMPETMDARMRIADKLVNSLIKNNVPMTNIYVDPLVQPIGTNSSFGIEFLNTVEAITKTFKGIHTMCGLSNISFGLPNRKFMNQMFAVMAIAKGLDGLIINPLDKAMMASLITAETLRGSDDFCVKYLKAFRKGAFEF